MRMGIGLGVGINRSNYAQGIFNAYSARVVADGGVVEGGSCVDAVSSLLQSASLLLIPSGYKGGKLYAEIPTNGNGDLTWTRGSDAFRTNASGLIQRVPWNLLQYSEAFDNAYWSKNSGGTGLAPVVTANATTAPDGTNTADKIYFNAGAGTTSSDQSNINRDISSTSGISYRSSIYLKGEIGGEKLVIRGSDGVYSLVTLTTSWQQVNNVAVTSSTTISYNFGIRQGLGGIGTINSTATIYAWGAQLVEGTTAQTYLPTTDRLNFPRLSYMYGSCPALLLEPQRTNVCLQSEDFSSASWTKTNVTVTSNSTTAPDGNTTADTLSKSAGLDATCVQEMTATSTGYAATIFIKQDNDETRFPEFFLRSSTLLGQNEIYVQLNTKTGATATRLSVGTTSVTAPVLIGGYWRMSLYVLANSNTVRVGVRPAVSTTLGGFNTNASGSIIAWGMQVEPNAAYPTTYIPTTSGATATRVADSFSRSNIYTNGLISASGGTWFVELRNNVSYVRDGIFRLGIGNTTALTTDSLYISGGFNTRNGIYKTVSASSSLLYNTTTDTTKIAIKWNGTTADIFANGTKVVSATSFTTTNMENLVSTGVGVPTFIQQMALFPTPLSDTDCTTLTT